MDYIYNVYLRRLVIKMLDYDINKRPNARDSFDELEIIELFIKSPKNKIIKKVLKEIKISENKENESSHNFKRYNSAQIFPNFQNTNFNQTFQNVQNFQNPPNYPIYYHCNFYNMNNQNIFQNEDISMNQINSNLNSNQMNLIINSMNDIINMNNQNKEEENLIIEYQDIYPEIKEKKIKVKFIFPQRRENGENFIYNIQIPSSLRKDELYSIVNYIYNREIDFPFNEIIEMIELFHNDIELENDNTQINYIKDFDSIIVKFNNSEIELYEDSYSLKTKNSKEFLNISFKGISSINKRFYQFGKNMTVEEMMKAFFIYNYINFPLHYFCYFYDIYYSSLELEYNKTLLESAVIDNSILRINFKCLTKLKNLYLPHKNPGKHLHVSVKDEINNAKFNFHAGTLQKIKDFYEYLNLYLIENKKIKENIVIYIGKIELKKDEERTFNSFGIRNDFTCIIKSKQKDLQ